MAKAVHPYRSERVQDHVFVLVDDRSGGFNVRLLKDIKQNDYQLSEGSIIMNLDRLVASLHRCVLQLSRPHVTALMDDLCREDIMCKHDVFKMACWKDVSDAALFRILKLCRRRAVVPQHWSVNISPSCTFTVYPGSTTKMELLDVVGEVPGASARAMGTGEGARGHT